MRRSPIFLKNNKIKSLKNGKKNILFLVQGSPQFDTLEPLHNYLKKEVNSHIVVMDIIASTPAENLLTRKKIKFLTLDSFFTKSETLLSMLKNFIKYKFILKKINEKLLKNIITQDEFQKFKSDASSIYFLGFFMDQLDKMIKKLEIDIIITANNVESTMGAVTHSAKNIKYNIFVYIIQLLKN